jgi:cytochrome P450
MVGNSEGQGVIDLSVLGEEFARHPYPVYEALRRRGPVHRIRMPEGVDAWLVVGYQEARAALADARLSKEWSNASPALGFKSIASGRHMLHADPPHHTRLRKLVSGAFTARRVQALEPSIQQLVDELLDAMLARPDGRADLVQALSFPLPISVICELLGVPFLDREQLRDWFSRVLAATDAAERTAATAEASGYFSALLEEKTRRPGDDLLSDLIKVTDDEYERLSRDELLGTMWLLLVAGHETTSDLISNGVLALLRHPGQLQLLREDPSLIGDAVEEMLRYDGPIETPTYRFTTEPIDFGGTTVPGGGELVLIALGDAGRDPSRFPDPASFDIRRAPKGHLAFGHGIHHCLGAPLARLEGRIAILSLLQRCPDLALDAEPAELPWRGGMMIRGPMRLPVRFRVRTAEDPR